jgi:raffinose/stachyose/melibiose transport system substrate-binding protein
MGKTRLLAAVLIIAAGASALVYGAGTRDRAGTVRKTVLLMNSKFEIDEGLKAAAAYYESQNPGITINVVSALDAAGSPEMKARFAGGEAPDIFALQGGNQLAVWESYLEDLSDQPWVKDMAEFTRPTITMNGRIYGWPLCVEGGAYMYNKRMFREAGIAEIPRTRSAFAETVQRLKGAGFTPLTEDGGWYALACYWVNYGFTNQRSPLDFIGGLNRGSETISNNAAFREVAGFIQWESAQIANRLAVDFQAAVAQFANEEAAITWGGNWNQLTINQIRPNMDIGFMPVPIFEDAAANDYLIGMTQYWCVNKDSPVKTEAKDFLSWLSGSREGQGFLTKNMALIPAFTTFRADPAGVGVLGKEFGDYQSLGKIRAYYGAYYPDGALQTLGETTQRLIAGQITADEYLRSLDADWKRLAQ